MGDAKRSWVKQTGRTAQVLSVLGAVAIAGYTAYATLSAGDWLTSIVATPLMGFLGWVGMRTFAAVILYPLAWSLVSVARAYRRAKGTVTVLQRTGVLRTARADTLAWRGSNNRAITLPHPTLREVVWTSTALWRRSLPYLRLLMVVVGGGTGIVACSDGFNLVAAGVTLVPAGLFIALLVMPSGGLDERAARHVAHALGVPLKPSKNNKGGWEVKLPAGGCAQMNGVGMAASPWGLRIALICPQLPFDLVATTRARLDEESGDLDLGHPAFDEATLLTPHKPLARTDLSSAWLLQPLRLHLLWALSNGARVHKGRLEADVDLRSPNALVLLDELVLAFDGAHAAMHARASSQKARALEALHAAQDDAQRGAIIQECLHLQHSSEAVQVWHAWVEQGQGPTRLDAAILRGGQAGPAWATLAVIAEDPDEQATVRAHALRLGLPGAAGAAALLLRWVNEGTAEPLVALAQQLAALETRLRAGAQRRVVMALATSTPPVAVRAPLVATVVALGARAVETVGSPRLVAWLDDLITTTETHTALSLLVDMNAEGPGGDEIRAAAIHAWTQYLSRLEGLRGGLAVAPEAEGGLELVD